MNSKGLLCAIVFVFFFVCSVTALEGDNDLARAYDAAFIDARDEVQALMVARANASSIRLNDCISSGFLKGGVAGADYPAYPTSATNILKYILDRKKITVGILTTNSLYDITKDKDVNIGIMQAIIGKMSAKYFGGDKTAIKFSFEERVDEYQLIYELLEGKIDILAPSYNHFISLTRHARLEHLTQTCAGLGLEVNFYTTHNVSTLNDVISLSRQAKKVMIVQTPEQQFLIDLMLGIKTEVRGFGIEPSMIVGNATISALISSMEFDPLPSIFLVNTSFVLPIRGVARTELPYVLIPDSQSEVDYYSGNNYLRTFFDNAISQTQAKSYVILNNPGSDFKIQSDCYPSVLGSPVRLDGISKKMYDEGIMKIGYYPITALPLVEYENINTPKESPANNLMTYREMEYIRQFGVKVGKDIKIMKTKYPSFDEMMAALDAGTIHATTAMTFLGASYKGEPLRKNYELSCSTMAWELSIFVNFERNANLKTFEQFKAKVYETPGAKIIVDSEYLKSIVATMFNSTLFDISGGIVIASTPAAAWALLNAPIELTANYLGYVPTFVADDKSPVNTAKILTDNVVNTGMVFRKNRRHYVSVYDGPDTYYPKNILDAANANKPYEFIPTVSTSGLAWYYWLLIAFSILLGIVIIAIIITLIMKCCCNKQTKHHKLKSDDDLTELESKNKKDNYTPPSISF